MALHDIDKHNGDRSNPTPNADDNSLKRDAHETVGTTYRRTGGNVKPTLVMQQGAIQSYDANNLINVFFGYKPSLNATRPVLRVAKDGYDAITAANDQLVFNSENNVFKIVVTNSTTITVPDPVPSGTVYTATIPHGLSVKPLVVATVDVPIGDGSASIQGKLASLPVSIIPSTGPAAATVRVYISADVDTTNLYLRVANTTGLGLSGVNGLYVFKYYILQETAN